MVGVRPGKLSPTVTSIVSEPAATSGATVTVKIEVAPGAFGVNVCVLIDVPLSFASNATVFTAMSSLVTTVAVTSRPA